MINLEELEPLLVEDLSKQLLNPRILLDRARLFDETSRKSLAYNDSTYMPFYYYLGKYIAPTNVLEFGFRLGLIATCFLTSCKTVNNYLAFQTKTKEFYSSRIGISNIKDKHKGKLDVWVGDILDNEFEKFICKVKWDLVIINEEFSYDKHMDYLEKAWQNMPDGGLLVHDYAIYHQPASDAIKAFAKIKNRKASYIKTRYGIAMLVK